MIARPSRLPREEFRGRGYRAVTTPFFSLKVRNNGLGASGKNRIGVVVGKSVDKRAVQRNFWERQVKAWLVKTPNTGKDFMVIIFPKVAELTRAEFGRIFSKTIQEALIKF